MEIVSNHPRKTMLLLGAINLANVPKNLRLNALALGIEFFWVHLKIPNLKNLSLNWQRSPRTREIKPSNEQRMVVDAIRKLA